MKYRVFMKVNWNILIFDFDNAVDALTFMDSAVNNYTGSVDTIEDKTTDVRYNVWLEIIKESPAE